MESKLELSAAMIGLYGAIGGAAFTLLGTLVTQIFTLIKDKKIAEIQLKEKTSEREFNARLNEENTLIQLFEDCLCSLAIFSQRDKKDPAADHSDEISTIQSSISKLSVKFFDDKLGSNLEVFTSHPCSHVAEDLRQDILRILKEFSGLKIHVSGRNNSHEKETEEKTFQFHIDDDYIISRFKDDGSILPKIVHVEYKVEDLTPEDREILLELYHSKGKISLNSNITLVTANGPELQKNRKIWSVSFDPREKAINEILSIWRKDYFKAKSSKV